MAGPPVLLVNRATTDWGVTPEALAGALQRFIDEHLYGVWGTAGTVEVAPELRPGCWGMVFLDHADQAQALGYHDLTPDGLPLGKVFVQPTLADGQRVSATASHELAEMLLDPALNEKVQASDGTIYAFEICDPVEGSEFTVDGVALSSFVYPAWFQEYWAPGSVRFDHLGVLTRPFELLPHGYMPVMKNGAWSRVFGSLSTEATHKDRDLRGRRRERRGRPLHRSTSK